jgi:hypothetical protein
MTRLGFFHPELRREARFDVGLNLDGRYDRDLVDLAAVPPTPPAGLVATPGVNQVSLTWTASPGATSYNIYRSLTSGSGYALIQTGVIPTAYVDGTAVGGITYYYVVTAVGPGGEGAFSVEDDATPFSPPVVTPGAPFPHSTTYDFKLMRALALADLSQFQEKVYVDFEAPVGLTDLIPLLSTINKPKAVLLYSKNDKPFAVNLGAGLDTNLHTVIYAVLQQNGPIVIQISCPEPSSIKVVAAGDP